MEVLIKSITRLFIALVIMMNLSTVVYANGNVESEVNSVKKDIEQLHKQTDELTNKVGQLSKDEMIKSLQEGQVNLIATADHAINRINMWIAVFSITVSVAIASGTIVTYFVQTKRFEALEKEIDKYKEDADEYKNKLVQASDKFTEAEEQLEASTKEIIKAKEELEGLKEEISKIRLDLSEARTQAEVAASIADSTKDKLGEQQQDIEKRFGEMMAELQEIKIEVSELADKAKVSEDNAKKSEDRSKAIQYFSETYNEQDLKRKIELFTKAIEHDENFAEAYNNRGNIYLNIAKTMNTDNTDLIIEECNKAIEDYDKSIKIYNDSEKYNDLEKYNELGMAYNNRGLVYQLLGEKVNKIYYEKAIKDFEFVVEKSTCSNVVKSTSYNNLAMTHRLLKKYDKAKEFVSKAILENESYGYSYSTLAEIYAEEGNDEEFYKNLELALINKCPVWKCISVDKVYAKYLDDEKFIELINKYKKD